MGKNDNNGENSSNEDFSDKAKPRLNDIEAELDRLQSKTDCEITQEWLDSIATDVMKIRRRGDWNK